MEIAHDSQPVYRQARFTDLTDIAAIEAEVFHEPYLYLMLRQLFELHGSAWLVAELEGAVIGYALVLEKDGKALLFTFAVARSRQGRTYGRALLEAALSRCRELGAREMSLTVRPDNLAASNLFKRVGFVFRAHDDRYFGPGEPRDVFFHPLRD
ncbi:GNAT family N-acetyltransferase [Nocardia nova]|uniref:GNAT family N-acetyltransferase n=1 Tax=Nocardia nova TaxID=37330 RepID=UPI0033C2A087